MVNDKIDKDVKIIFTMKGWIGFSVLTRWPISGHSIMKVEHSTYLMNVKPLARQLVTRLLEEFAYVSLLGTDTVGKLYNMKKTGVNLNDSKWSERGFVLRVYNGQNYSEHSFNHLSESNLEMVIEEIKETANAVFSLMNDNDIQVSKYDVIEEAVIKEQFASEVAVEPRALSHEEILAKMRQMMEESLSKSDELIDVRINYEMVKVAKIFLSGEKDLEQTYVWSNAYVIPIGVREGKMKYAYNVVSGLKGHELLTELEEHCAPSVEQTAMLLGSEPIEAGEYDIILDPEMAGLVAHEAFGHGVEMDMFVKERAKAAEFMDKAVASDKVVMYDGAKSAEEVSSYFFDDEGTIGTDTKIIDDGILRSGISDILSALTLGTEPTGNGKRESYEHKAYARMTNTFFGPGKDSLEDMVASMSYGYLLESYSSGMEDPKNWGIQCVVSRAREIKDGQFTGKVCSPVYLTGYVPDLLKSMSMVSDLVELTGGGYCGKGYKEFVKTSTGGPFIKARGRLN